jgi:cellulose biosynthesis protein BcsQ
VRPGEIVTFYSYKGGTGRSMLLANVAWILACNGKRVLALDWDLEAPGLHRYFHPFLLDKDGTQTDGVIDFVIDYSIAALEPSEEHERDRWFLPYANILRYASSLDWEFPSGGTLDFVGAGRQGPSYPTRVNSFNWQDFYERFGGGAFLEEMKQLVKERYDYVLVDSRTGVSDTSGICTLQLPDTLVVCFTLNNQSIEGAAAVADSVHEQRQNGKPIRILPVAMRIENSEKAKLDMRKSYARERLGRYPEPRWASDTERYWADVELLYVPFYAYEEVLATFGDQPGEGHSVLAASERITSYLTNGEVRRSVRPSEARRAEVLAAYGGQIVPLPTYVDAPSAGSIYISYRREDTSGFAGLLYDALSSRFGPERVFTDVATLSPGVDFVELVESRVRRSSVVLVLVGPRWLSATDASGRRRIDDPEDFLRGEVAAALEGGGRVIPVLVEGATMPARSELPPELEGLARRQALELNPERLAYDLQRLITAIELSFAADRSPLASASQESFESRRPLPDYESDDLLELLDARRRLRRLTLATAVIGAIGVLGIALLLFVFL